MASSSWRTRGAQLRGGTEPGSRWADLKGRAAAAGGRAGRPPGSEGHVRKQRGRHEQVQVLGGRGARQRRFQKDLVILPGDGEGSEPERGSIS